jgi:hypothetical protein
VLRAPVLHKENELRAVLGKIQGLYTMNASHAMSQGESCDEL